MKTFKFYATTFLYGAIGAAIGMALIAVFTAFPIIAIVIALHVTIENMPRVYLFWCSVYDARFRRKARRVPAPPRLGHGG